MSGAAASWLHHRQHRERRDYCTQVITAVSADRRGRVSERARGAGGQGMTGDAVGWCEDEQEVEERTLVGDVRMAIM
jgi:hypothetical protein